MESAKRALVSFGGLGYLPVAPGTWGSGGAACVYIAIRFAGVEGAALIATCLGISAAAFLVTGLLGRWAEEYYGKKDPGQIVTDEVAGYFLTVTLFTSGPWWAAAGGAFFFFRYFDIVKLWPASALEKVPGGWGVALDDMAAGVYACICNHALLLLIARYS